ncbi:unnamed protein product [Brassica rapa subsp. narinosa]
MCCQVLSFWIHRYRYDLLTISSQMISFFVFLFGKYKPLSGSDQINTRMFLF